MTKKEAIEVLSRYRPCEHWNRVTLSGNWLRCEDCGAIYEKVESWKYEQAAKDFDEAIDACLYS